MNVLYVGHPEGTCAARYRALLKLEPSVEFFDSGPYSRNMPAWQRAIEYFTFVGPRFRRGNRELVRRCEQLRPDVVWIDKGFWVSPATLARLKSQGPFLVAHFTDALHSRSKKVWWLHALYRKSLSLYDLFFSSMPQDVAWMRKRGLSNAELTSLGYDHQRFDDTPLAADAAVTWSNELLFAGHHEPRTERSILALLEAGLPIRVYGSGWHRARQRDRLRDAVKLRTLTDAEYVMALKGTKIGLGFVSELNANQTSARSFEIPACGTFLLALQTPEHLACFQEGREAEFFEDDGELVRKARYYLEHDSQRREIARRGHERCIGSDYSWARYMREDWGKVRSALARTR